MGRTKGNLGRPIERLGRHNQNWTAAFLFVPLRPIESDQPDLAAFHQIISRPTDLAFSHSRPCLTRRAAGLH
jgi:hypothetical protein